MEPGVVCGGVDGVKMSLEEGLTRREATRLILVGGVYIASNPIGLAIQSRHDAQPSCTYTLFQVREGLVSPKDYVADKAQCLPEVRQAISDGKLAGILFQPTDHEVEDAVSHSFSSKIEDPVRVDQLVRTQMKNYVNDKSQEKNKRNIGKFIPSLVAVFGEGHPHYILFTDNLVLFPEINNDADVDSIFRHELEHLLDFNRGITLGNRRLSYAVLRGEAYSAEFMHHLLEVRATYNELRNAFYERVTKGNSSVSPRWLGHQSRYYAESWDFLKKNAKSDFEKEISKLQLAESNGIRPEIEGGTLFISCDLFGQKVRLRIVRPK